MNKSNIKIVNNTKADLSPLHALIVDAIETGTLHEDLSDMFTLTVRNENEMIIGVVNWA